jgi:hypothetical protein
MIDQKRAEARRRLRRLFLDVLEGGRGGIGVPIVR